MHFVYIFIKDKNFLNKIFSSDPSFNRNILTSLFLKCETYVHVQLRDKSFIHDIYKFYDMVPVGNLDQG